MLVSLKIFLSSERYITETNIPLYSEKNVLNLQTEVVSTTIERVLTVVSFGWPFGIRHRTCEKLLNKRNRFSSIVRQLSRFSTLLRNIANNFISYRQQFLVFCFTLFISGVIFTFCQLFYHFILTLYFNPLEILKIEIPSENVDYLRSLYFASVWKKSIINPYTYSFLKRKSLPIQLW